MYIDLQVKYSLFFANFNEIRNSSTEFRKTSKDNILWKSVKWEPSWYMRAGGERTDMTKLIVAFPNFANAPTNATLITVHVADVYESCSVKYKWRRLSIIPDPTKQALYWAVETLHKKHFKQNAKSLFCYCRHVENIWLISITSVALFYFCEKLISVDILFILNEPNITSTFHIEAMLVTVYWQTVFST